MRGDHDPLHLAFDVGTGGTKGALLAPDGTMRASAFAEHTTDRSSGGVVEQDSDGWWRAVVEVARQLPAKDLGRVEAVVVTGQMQDLTLLDEAGWPLRPTILYSDLRAEQEAEEITERLGLAALRRLTGNDQGPGGLLAKLLWLKRHETEAYEAAHRLFLGAADLIVFRLTGEPVSDSTTASTTGLIDLAKRRPLDADLFASLGLARVPELLPRLQVGGLRAGTLSNRAAEELGLTAGTPVHLAPGDAGAATIGAGSGEIGPAYGYIGTSGWVALSSEQRADPEGGAITLAHPHPQRFIRVAPLLTAGGNLEWVRDLFRRDEQVDSFDSLLETALSTPPERLLYLPYLAGERSPINDPLARAALVGLDPGSGRHSVYRAVLEGVVFGYRHALQALLPGGVERLLLTGGGTRSPAWCQLFATILGAQVVVSSEAEHAGLRGAQLAMLVADGAARDYRLDPVGRTFRPDPRQRAHYDRLYALYLRLHPALKELFAALAAV